MWYCGVYCWNLLYHYYARVCSYIFFCHLCSINCRAIILALLLYQQNYWRWRNSVFELKGLSLYWEEYNFAFWNWIQFGKNNFRSTHQCNHNVKYNCRHNVSYSSTVTGKPLVSPSTWHFLLKLEVSYKWMFPLLNEFKQIQFFVLFFELIQLFPFVQCLQRRSVRLNLLVPW